MLRTPTILPNIRISRCLRSSFMLIFGRGIKFKNHSCASTSWFLTFAPGIIYFTPLLPLGQPFSMFHVKHVHGFEYSEPHSQNRFFKAFILLMYGFSPYTCLKICSIMQAYIAYLYNMCMVLNIYKKYVSRETCMCYT